MLSDAMGKIYLEELKRNGHAVSEGKEAMNEHIREISAAKTRQQRLMREAADERLIKAAFAESNGSQGPVLASMDALRRFWSRVRHTQIRVSIDYVEPRPDCVQSH